MLDEAFGILPTKIAEVEAPVGSGKSLVLQVLLRALSALPTSTGPAGSAPSIPTAPPKRALLIVTSTQLRSQFLGDLLKHSLNVPHNVQLSEFLVLVSQSTPDNRIGPNEIRLSPSMFFDDRFKRARVLCSNYQTWGLFRDATKNRPFHADNLAERMNVQFLAEDEGHRITRWSHGSTRFASGGL